MVHILSEISQKSMNELVASKIGVLKSIDLLQMDLITEVFVEGTGVFETTIFWVFQMRI